MAWIGGEFCIDQYENSLSFNTECTSPLVPANEYLPTDFPPCVGCTESNECWESCNASDSEAQTITLYACSLVGEIPTRKATFFQARQACENVGKRICLASEWQAACTGLNREREYPYGTEYSYGTCVDSGSGAPDESRLGPAPTGSFTMCQTPEGIFDLVGNIGEHAADDYYDDYIILGADYSSSLRGDRERLDCYSDRTNLYWMNDSGGGTISGFRCCLDPP